MRLILLLFLIVTFISGFSQDWAPIKQTDTVIHFISKNDIYSGRQFKPIQSVVLDTSYGNVNVYKKGYASTLVNNLVNVGYDQLIKAQMLGDTIAYNADSIIVYTIDTNWFTFTFLRNYSLNSTWRFGLSNRGVISASVDSLIFMNLGALGQDSVAKISLQGASPFNGTNIYISKLNGLIELPNLSSLYRPGVFVRYQPTTNTIKDITQQRLRKGDEITLWSEFISSQRNYPDVRSNSIIQKKVLGDSVINGMTRVMFQSSIYKKDLMPDYGVISSMSLAFKNYSCVFPDDTFSNGSFIETNSFGMFNILGQDLLVEVKRTVGVFNNYISQRSGLDYENTWRILGVSNEFDSFRRTSGGSSVYGVTVDTSIVYIKKDSMSFGLKPTINCKLSDTLIREQSRSLEALNGDFSYQWLDCSSNSVAITNATNRVFTPTSSGFYSVLINEGTCFDTSRCVEFFLPNCTLEDTLVKRKMDTLFSTIKEATYKWLDCDNSLAPIPNEISSFFIPNGAGNYALEITKSNCTDTSRCIEYLPPNCRLGDTLIRKRADTIFASIEGESYRWLDCDTSLAPIPNEVSSFFIPTEDGNYVVEITKSNCIDTSRCIEFVLPKCNLGDTLIRRVNDTLFATIEAATYRWLDCNGSVVPFTNPVLNYFIPTKGGSYAVEITKNNCTDTSECVTWVGVFAHKNLRNSISISPNPVKKILNIRAIDNVSIEKIQVFDSSGRMIFDISGSSTVDFTHFSRGVYNLKILVDGQVVSKKVIKN